MIRSITLQRIEGPTLDEVPLGILMATVVASLLFAGCGGESPVGTPTQEELPHRAKYQDLHPTAPSKKPVRVKAPNNG